MEYLEKWWRGISGEVIVGSCGVKYLAGGGDGGISRMSVDVMVG